MTSAPNALDDETLAASAASPASGAPRAIPPTIGKYTILDRIGAGAMGSVFSAWDSDLERRVAVKMLHPDGDPDRFVREAQLLAKLKHPNVVTVYDVGRAGGDVFIAMELIEGSTLRKWLDEKRRWRDVLRVYRAAGQGLAAAHAAGLIHRDFKPDNVLVDEDGFVRVVDFGLARLLSEKLPDGTQSPTPSSDMTETGQVLGTPRYMAPEQGAGAPIDERADQYSFAVALWEALYGEHPVSHEKRGRGTIDKPPSRIRRALERALATQPLDRWPSMQALLVELARDPAVLWRRIGVVTLAVATIVIVRFVFAPAKPEAACQHAERKLAGIWDAPTRATVQKAFLATGKPLAADVFARTARALDAYTGRWVAMRQDACEATAVRKEQSAALLDLRMECLDRRARELGALTQLFASANAETLDSAIVATARLVDLAPCADAEALTSVVPLPANPEVRARIAELRAAVDRAHAFGAIGKFAEQEKIVAPIVEESKRIAFPPLHAEAAAELVRAVQFKDPKLQEATLDDSVAAAAAAHDDRRMIAAFTDLANVVGVNAGRPDEALGIVRAAEVMVDRIDDDHLRANLLAVKGKVLSQSGKPDQAIPILERAVKGTHLSDIELANGLTSLGNALRKVGRLDEAQVALERVHDIYTRTFGPDHPYVAGTLINLGNLAHDRKQYDVAEKIFRQALAIQEAHLPAEHVDIARTLTNLGNVMIAVDRLDEGEQLLQRSLAMKKKLLPPGHQLVTSSMLVLGQLQHKRHHDDEALAMLRDTLALREKAGADTLPVAEVLVAIGEVLVDQKKCPDATPQLERAIAIYDKQGAKSAADARAVLARCAAK